MVCIAHVSDLHVGSLAFYKDLLIKVIDEVNNIQPDITIITGDITENGYFMEFEKAADYLDKLDTPMLVIPGNHDARHVGDKCFSELIKTRYGTLKLKEKKLEVIGLDSSEPDLDYGKIGRSQQEFMEKELAKAQKHERYTIIALHHHIIPVPQTGRERNVLIDAGDILQSILNGGANLVVSGHKHMPHVWIMEDTVFATAGTASSLKLRGKTFPSYNTVQIEEDTIEIVLRGSDGKQRMLAKHEYNCR